MVLFVCDLSRGTGMKKKKSELKLRCIFKTHFNEQDAGPLRGFFLGGQHAALWGASQPNSSPESSEPLIFRQDGNSWMCHRWMVMYASTPPSHPLIVSFYLFIYFLISFVTQSINKPKQTFTSLSVNTEKLKSAIFRLDTRSYNRQSHTSCEKRRNDHLCLWTEHWFTVYHFKP